MIKEIDLNKIPEGETYKYLINESKGTAIKIPDSVLKTILTKLRDTGDNVHISLLMSNAISVAIQFKATGKFRYVAFWKFLHHLLSNKAFNGYLNDNEIHDLLDFLGKVPSGYSFNDGNRVWAHSEIGSIITF